MCNTLSYICVYRCASFAFVLNERVALNPSGVLLRVLLSILCRITKPANFFEFIAFTFAVILTRLVIHRFTRNRHMRSASKQAYRYISMAFSPAHTEHRGRQNSLAAWHETHTLSLSYLLFSLVSTRFHVRHGLLLLCVDHCVPE